MDYLYKEGFLQKAGKRSFQGWRKRWFILQSCSLKYYNPATEYNDTNLLGAIQMVEIQSISPSKSQKFGFDIITRTRTYNVSAKSDLERDDWILALRKASSSKRQLDSTSQQDSSRGYSEITSIPSPRIESSSTEYEYVTAPKSSQKPDKKSKEKNKGKNSRKECKMNTDDKDVYEEIKPRTQSCLSEVVEKTEMKPRASTHDDVFNSIEENVRAHSMLRKISRTGGGNENTTTNLYHELDDELEKCSSGDDEEEEEDVDTSFSGDYAVPKPRGDKYAFDEIRKLFDLSELERMQKEMNFDAVSKVNDLKLDEKEEFPAMALLKMYIERLNKTPL